MFFVIREQCSVVEHSHELHIACHITKMIYDNKTQLIPGHYQKRIPTIRPTTAINSESTESAYHLEMIMMCGILFRGAETKLWCLLFEKWFRIWQTFSLEIKNHSQMCVHDEKWHIYASIYVRLSCFCWWKFHSVGSGRCSIWCDLIVNHRPWILFHRHSQNGMAEKTH